MSLTEAGLELKDRLLHRELDFVLSFRPQGSYPKIESHILFEDHPSVVVRHDHPLAKKERGTPSDLSTYPVVLPAKDLQARNVLEDIYKKETSKEFIRILCETSLVKKRTSEWLGEDRQSVQTSKYFPSFPMPRKK